MRIKSTFFALCFLAATATATAGEAGVKPPVLTPPDGYVEFAPAGMHECAGGTKAQVSRAEFRRFALRNQLWPQEDDVDLSPANWTAGRTLSDPSLDFRTSGQFKRKLKAQVYALVGSDGTLLDAMVTCTNSPASSAQLLQLVETFRFEPSRYKGQGLNTLIPIPVEL